MDLKNIALAIVGLVAIIAIPNWESGQALSEVTPNLDVKAVEELNKIQELTQLKSVEGCWASVKTIAGEGLWYGQSLEANIQLLRESCLSDQAQ